MKKKLIIGIIAASMMLGTAVGAAGYSMWGTYKGNEIVRLTVDGVPANITDVPAFSYNNRTMVPVYLLQQAGLKYSWDEKNKTVNVENSKPATQPSTSEMSSISENSKPLFKNGVFLVSYNVNQKEPSITYYYNGSIDKLSTDSVTFEKILSDSTKTDAAITEIIFLDAGKFNVPTQKLRDFYNGNITASALSSFYNITPPPRSNITTTNSQQTQNTQTQNSNNGCTVLKENQASELSNFDNNNQPSSWDGSSSYRRDMMIRNQQQSASALGCGY